MTNDNIFSRRVAKVLPDQASLEKLMSQRKIRLYQGFDPTGARLHLGHAVGMKKLMDFARAGHEVIFLFGTGTVLAGDPSLRDEARPHITQDQIDENIKNWKRQAEGLVDFSLVTIKQNGDWLTKMNLADIINVASNLSAIQLFKRDSFTRRLDHGNTVWYHETMYPMLQGYDSVVMDVDLEIGGTDQEFNMLVGRELMQKMKGKDKWVLETPMIMGTDGKQMSKSSGNCVWLDDMPEDKFGKLMALQDDLIIDYLTHVTDMPLNQVAEQEMKLKQGANPRDIKLLMAHQVVQELHDTETADRVQAGWLAQFSDGEMPTDIPEVELSEADWDVADLLTTLHLAESKSEARRLFEQGGVKLNQKPVTTENITIQNNDVVQVGKRRFVRVTVE